MRKLNLVLVGLLCVSVLTCVSQTEATDNVPKKVNAKIGLNFVFSSTSSVSTIQISPKPFPWSELWKIFEQVAGLLGGCAIGGKLLAFRIWNAIKRLRRGRPRDYRGVAFGMLGKNL